MRSTPSNAVLVESGEIPRELRRDKLSLVYWIHLRGCGEENATKSILNECWEYRFNGNGFGWQIKDKSKEYDLEGIQFSFPTPISNVPPWLFPKDKLT